MENIAINIEATIFNSVTASSFNVKYAMQVTNAKKIVQTNQYAINPPD